MAIKFNRSQTFATNGTVTAPSLHNLVDGLDIYQALITDQTNLTSVGTADELLIADADLTANDAPRAVTVQELFDDALTVGTYTNAQFVGTITHGTSTGTRTVSSNASITTGTINNATLGTTNGTVATFTSSTLGTTTATAANITNGTIQTLTSSTATITGGTFSGLLNSSTGTFSGLTSGIINSTTGTIGNFTTTLTGDVTITQGTATLGTTGVTAGTYGTSSIIPTIVVDSKGRITTVSTSQFTPANSSITPSMLSQPLTLATSVASTSGTAIDFTGIPSWAKKITVMFNGVSTNGTSVVLIQIGAGSFTTSGYSSTGFGSTISSVGNLGYTNGFPTTNEDESASDLRSGIATIASLGSNIWVFNSMLRRASGKIGLGAGGITLSGVLDRIRITTVNGTDTFDAGSINIMYEG